MCGMTEFAIKTNNSIKYKSTTAYNKDQNLCCMIFFLRDNNNQKMMTYQEFMSNKQKAQSPGRTTNIVNVRTALKK